ncbi:uncharacterized protein LOC119719900 isoform X1 [Patiria miniata]|uniref:Uncharacterized protein n=1 Tax=Patiria miniata TaxID=46514 RepID=A0A913Z3L6_PATMI|nr:uncharacterized protein LOC119719900 isoform X1 [Patiria miniata]
MSKVCEQVLKEVLQLDNDLCQQSPLLQGSISQPVVGSKLSTKLEMEKFSSQVTEGTGNRHSVHSPDQQVPIQGIEPQMESPGCLTVERSKLQKDNNAEPIQNDKERCDNKEEEDGSPRLVMSCDVKPEREGLPDGAETTYEVAADGIPSDKKHDIETLESGEKQNGPPASGPSRMKYEEKATQCNILIVPTEDRATLCEVKDFTNAASACGCSKAEQSLTARGGTDKPKPMCDAYDECIVS